MVVKIQPSDNFIDDNSLIFSAVTSGTTQESETRLEGLVTYVGGDDPPLSEQWPLPYDDGRFQG